MEAKILTDKEKIEKWHKICVENKILDKNEITNMMKYYMISFTNYGSVIPTSVYSVIVPSREAAEEIVKNSKPEELAKYILQALCGVLQFKDLVSEFVFWKKAKKRMNNDFVIDLDEDILPYYISKDTFNIRERFNITNEE